MPENTASKPAVGVPTLLARNLSVVLAPNPSPMTYWGTNTYLLGDTSLAIIDPGPDDENHLRALLNALDDRPVTHILVTHSHLDHSPLARPLAEHTGAPILAFGNSMAGRRPIMHQLAKDGLAGGGEGIDHDFHPDVILQDGDDISGDGWTLKAIHTPGHLGNHLCFQWETAVFTGDHIMGWSTSLVSPPDGSLTDFMQSCATLQDIPATVYYPGHGAPIREPLQRLDWLIAHRKSREAQIHDALQHADHSVQSLTAKVYSDLNPALLPAAERNVFAHLIDLENRGKITAEPRLSITARFHTS